MYSLTFGSFLWSAPVQDETAHHCFLYFIKLFYIFRALDCDHFFESVRVKIWSGRTLCHTPHPWAEQKQCVCRMGASARARRSVKEREGARRCAKVRAAEESNGGFGFQTKVKDSFLTQRRWTCWYSCRENTSPVRDRQFSLTFCFHFEKLVIFAVYLTLHNGGFPYFFILLLFDSSVFAKH